MSIIYAFFKAIEAFKKSIDKNTAGVFIEPIQGEGGINVASIKYLSPLIINKLVID